ncbi:MAG TPA: amidohydrolase family protein [Xanthobacteraceae bacterium]|nr:amidohydrolase family protein [Xanthobacteraceae bacterium]
MESEKLLRCDCHVHVFDDSDRFPPKKETPYQPPLAATIDDVSALHRAHQIDATVIVQPIAYGADHRVLMNALSSRSNLRGVAAVNGLMTKEDVSALDAAGVCAARFGLGSGAQGPFDRDAAEAIIELVRPFGWHIKIGAMGQDIAIHAEWLRSLPVTIVFDHMTGLGPSADRNDQAVMSLLEMLEQPDRWIMISCPDRRSVKGELFEDMLPIARALLRQAPDRAIWASDWPHVLYQRSRMPRYGDLIRFLELATDGIAAIDDVLGRNPTRLYRFN